ncbi:MAG: hypothetical protein AB7L41_15555 [Flavobacteriaceae bacterium]
MTLKIIHILALGLGLGLAAVKGIVGARVRAATPEIAAEHRTLQGTLGRVGAWALVAIWVTGLAMFFLRYGGDMAGLGGAFHVKMLFVVIFTGLTGYAMMTTARARREGKPADPARMRKAGMAGGIALVLAVVFAVIAFG